MSELFSWFSSGGFLDLSRPEIILILAEALMPYSLVAIFVIFFLVYTLTKKIIVKNELKVKHYFIIIIVSLLIEYLLLIGLMNFAAFGLGRLTQYI